MLLVLSAPLPMLAQQPPVKETPTISCSANALGGLEIPPLYYLDATNDSSGKLLREYKPFPVSTLTRMPAVKIPATPPVALYTGRFDEKGKPIMNSYLEIPVKGPQEKLLLLFYRDAAGKTAHDFLDDGVKAHPAGTVRVLNYSPQGFSPTVGKKTYFVAPGGQGLFGTPEMVSPGRFVFRYRVQTPGVGDYESSVQLLEMRTPEDRILIIYSAMPVVQAYLPGGTPPSPKYAPNICLLIDRIEPATTTSASNRFPAVGSTPGLP